MGEVTTIRLHPPDELKELSQVVNFPLMAAWVWQAASLALDGQVNNTGVGEATVKLDEHVVVKGAQLVV